MPKDKNIRTARQKDADELHMTSTLAVIPLGLLTLIESNTASIDTTLDISLSVFRDAIRGAATKDFSTIQTVLDSIKDTDGIKKITDAVTLNSLPTGDNVIGRVKVTDGTDILLIDGSGRITVVQAEKDRTISGNVGLLTSGDVRINPAKEDGNLASIKTNTDNLDITTSAFRDAIRGANTKDFSTLQTVLDSIKGTDGIKKITDALPAGTNKLGSIEIIDYNSTDKLEIDSSHRARTYDASSYGKLNTIDVDTGKIANTCGIALYLREQEAVLVRGHSFGHDNRVYSVEKVHQYNCQSFDFTEDGEQNIDKRVEEHVFADLNFIDISWCSVHEEAVCAEIEIYWYNKIDEGYVRVAHEFILPITELERSKAGNRHINIDIPLTGDWDENRYGYIRVSGGFAGTIRISVLHYTFAAS